MKDITSASDGRAGLKRLSWNKQGDWICFARPSETPSGGEVKQCPGTDAVLGTTPVAGRNDKLHPKVEVQLSWSALEYCSPRPVYASCQLRRRSVRTRVDRLTARWRA